MQFVPKLLGEGGGRGRREEFQLNTYISSFIEIDFALKNNLKLVVLNTATLLISGKGLHARVVWLVLIYRFCIIQEIIV